MRLSGIFHGHVASVRLSGIFHGAVAAMAWRLKGSLLFRRRALTRPRGKRGLAAEIRVLPFHDYKRLQMASLGAMAIPDRRIIAAFCSAFPSRPASVPGDQLGAVSCRNALQVPRSLTQEGG